jgi:hypothetical protein
VLHLLNGDATAAVFPSTLPGDRAVWRDIMVEGPPVDDGAGRARWLAPRLGLDAAAYERGWREGRATLQRAAAADEIVLWFEQDLFCAVNLWFVLDRLPPAASVSLVFPVLTEAFGGLGTLAAGDFEPLFARRGRLDAQTRAEAATLWRAYAGEDPTATGADVLAGRLDGLARRTLDRWLGGVHLHPGAPDWRQDGARLLRR